MQHTILFGTRRIDFTLVYSRRKTLGIRVQPDMTTEVLAPVDTPETVIMKKVRLKAPWILRQIDHFNSFLPHTPLRKYISGETHLYLGRQYKLKIVTDAISSVKAYRGLLMVSAKNTKAKTVELLLQKWYRQRAEVVFREMLEEVFPRFEKYEITRPEITIQKMSKRWGSCTSDGKIILNVELIRASKGCIEYVVVHELCHLIYRNHNRAFFNLQCQLLPDWEKWKEKLEYSLA